MYRNIIIKCLGKNVINFTKKKKIEKKNVFLVYGNNKISNRYAGTDSFC